MSPWSLGSFMATVTESVNRGGKVPWLFTSCILTALSYTTIWAFIEPLELEEWIFVAGDRVHRATLHCLASVVFAALVVVVLRWRFAPKPRETFYSKADELTREMVELRRSLPDLAAAEKLTAVEKATAKFLALAVTIKEEDPTRVFANLMRFDPAENSLKIDLVHGFYRRSAHQRVFYLDGQRTEGSCGKAFRLEKPIIVDDARRDERASLTLDEKEERLISILSIPLGRFGVLNVDSQRPRYFRRTADLETRIQHLQRLGTNVMALRTWLIKPPAPAVAQPRPHSRGEQGPPRRQGDPGSRRPFRRKARQMHRRKRRQSSGSLAAAGPTCAEFPRARLSQSLRKREAHDSLCMP